MPNKHVEINGGKVVYEMLGKEGDVIVLTPGGRFSKDIPGLKPLARKLVEGGYRGAIGRVASTDSFVPLGPAAASVLLGEDEIADALVSMCQIFTTKEMSRGS